MVGVEGGFMAMIHYVLKRPIAGLLGVAGLVGAELGGYPVLDSTVVKIRGTCIAIAEAPENISGLVGRKLTLLEARRDRNAMHRAGASKNGGAVPKSVMSRHPVTLPRGFAE